MPRDYMTMADKERNVNADNSASNGGMFEDVIRPIVAELVGVCFFVFVGCLSTTQNSLPAIAIAHGFTIALLIMCLGEISGGHFNPAVTLGVTLAGGIKPMLALGYMGGQLVGATLGASFVRATLPSEVYANATGGTHQLGNGVEPGWGIYIEMVLTAVLVFAVVMSAVNSRTKSALAPLAIGFAVTVDIAAAGPLTGASMNPARAFGPALVAWGAGLDHAWRYHYIYWIGPFLGSVIVGLLYRFFFAGPSQRWVARRVDAVYDSALVQRRNQEAKLEEARQSTELVTTRCFRPGMTTVNQRRDPNVYIV